MEEERKRLRCLGKSDRGMEGEKKMEGKKERRRTKMDVVSKV